MRSALLVLLVLVLAGAAGAQEYRPAPFVLDGHGEGGDGLGYGFRGGHVDPVTRAYSTRPTPDSRPRGFHDNGTPGYRAHGMRFSHNFFGRTRIDPIVEFIGDRRERGRHETTLTFDRQGRPVHLPR